MVDPVDKNRIYVMNEGAFVGMFPAAQATQETIMHAIMKNVDSRGLDFIALGVGDGKSESRLAAPLSERMPPSLLRFYLLDISHPLLVAAHKHAVASVPPQVAVFPIHGNFLDLRRILALQLQPGQERRRLWTMFGNTFGNLSHEPDFVRDVSSCAQPGDFLLLNVPATVAPANNESAIRRNDRRFAGRAPRVRGCAARRVRGGSASRPPPAPPPG